MTELEALKFFQTPDHPCSYLPSEQATTELLKNILLGNGFKQLFQCVTGVQGGRGGAQSRSWCCCCLEHAFEGIEAL